MNRNFLHMLIHIHTPTFPPPFNHPNAIPLELCLLEIESFTQSLKVELAKETLKCTYKFQFSDELSTNLMSKFITTTSVNYASWK